MKLVKFSVTNFRSILKALDILILDTTVLVGQNNEGKSNLLKALAIAMNAIKGHAREVKRREQNNSPARRSRLPRRDAEYLYGYDWERDFPVSKRNGKEQQTIFKLEFELTAAEVDAFKKEIKSNLNGTLPIRITISEKSEIKIKVVKSGPGNKPLNDKSSEITDYISARISFNYIPAVRTYETIRDVIAELLSEELFSLEDDPGYKEALQKISDLQQPVLKKLSEQIKEPLSEFLPDIKDVKINISEDSRPFLRYRTGFNVEIDDGTPTSLEYKGDGVQNLAALGLLKNKSQRTDASIIAIEEPESHLHPGAIRRLQETIESLGGENQIVLTTHNPLFVNRHSVSSNIIVAKGKAEQAKTIEKIREILGVEVSDNLIHSRFVLVVEGENDERALRSILTYFSPQIADALKKNTLTIDYLGGAGKLSYTLLTLKSQLCSYHVFLDHDQAAGEQSNKAIQENLLSEKSLTQTISPGMKESEFEDCISPSIYKQEIRGKYGVRLDVSKFRGDKKWSDRMKECFLSQGKAFTDTTKQRVKKTVSECVEANPGQAIDEHKGGSIQALIKALEELIALK